MEIHQRFLKPFVAWGTALTDSYRNPFTRTTIQIIALQVILTVILIGVFAWAIEYSQESTVGSISQHIAAAIASPGPESVATATKSLPQAIDDVRMRVFGYVFIGLIALTTLFGYLIARFALQPARNSLQAQKRFIGNLAHELRTPLTTIKTSTEVALLSHEVSSSVRETLENTIENLDRISETINNLLSFETLSHPLRMKWETIDLVKVAETVVDTYQTLAHTRGIALSLTASSEESVQGNGTALEQVITNLVKNALNYTPAHAGNTVAVRIERDYRGRPMLTVADTGVGIAEKDLYHIFEPFYRGDTSRTRGVGTGTSGLGLAIVSEIVRTHHGIITLRSALGEGTQISVTFPRTETHKKQSAAAQLPAPVSDMQEVSLDFS